jgi:c(7)-type cytochrome triheme protein
MRKLIAACTIVAFALAFGAILAEDKKPPATITFEAKPGPVTFDHAKHADRVKGDCKACHDKLFKQEKGDLHYKESMHKKAETDKTSCGACHVAGGAAFETKGNCNKCHVKKTS